MKEVFNLDNYDILEDMDNYYVFRALNKEDNNDIENNITTDNKSNITRIRTDRERYMKEALYDMDSPLTLKQIFDHIKMHHRKDTNCISLTTNANVSLLYGREYYKDKYVIIKVPKKEVGTVTFNAGLYMIEEINKIIDILIKNKEISEEMIIYLNAIDKVKSKDELDILIHSFKKEDVNLKDNMFEKGIEYSDEDITTVDYQALNREQNLEKDKIVAKLNLIKTNILPNVSNRFLIQTIGNAFSSLELIHYNEIKKENIIEVPKEIIDIISLIQQLPNTLINKKELKEELLRIILSNNYHIESYEYDNYHLNINNDYSIDRMYELTNGNIGYKTSINLYKKSFYLSKSKLRTISSINLLNKLIDNNPKYKEIIDYLIKNTYGVEPKIFSKLNGNKLQVSESVNLDISAKELELFNFINNLSENDLKFFISNPQEALKYYIRNFKNIKIEKINREEYYANAIIDLFDWSKINVIKFDENRRNDLVKKLIENNVVELYNYLKNNKVPEDKIANTLLTIAIKNKKLDKIELNDTFSIEELDDFMGYYKLKETKLKLKSYQALALENINMIHSNYNFATAILPTGAGKSFVALAKMLEYKEKKILYLAPNDIILNQIKDYIIEYICGNTNKKTRDNIIKEVFPNLTLATYQSLLSFNEQYKEKNRLDHKIINCKYDLIIFDELHRSGALEWNKQINELLDNQKENTKVLGITATPERDIDLVNMADYWALKLGFTEEEINRHKHLAINMDLEEAINLGYVINPRKVECLYTLEENGYFNSLNSKIETIKDEEKKKILLRKLNIYRRQALNADGIEKVIGDNIKLGGRYIVFCPIINENGIITEDEDGNIIDSRITGEDVINKYIEEIKSLLKKYYNISNEEIDNILEFHSMLGKYGSAKNNSELKKFERSNHKKIKFMVVMNKLNEGAHAKNDGLIWFRPLDPNSKILYYQQMGRVIYTKNPNEDVNHNDLPIIIDIPCNSLMIGLNKRKKILDIDKLINIYGWIQNNNKIPDLNSTDRVEASYGMILKRIKEKYIKYIDNNILNTLSSKERQEVLEILEIGSKIDLWNYDFPDKLYKNNDYIQTADLKSFSIFGIIKNLYELEEEINKSAMAPTIEDRLEEIRKLGYIPKKYSRVKFKKYNADIYIWINMNKEEILKLYNSNPTAKWICDTKGWLNKTTIEDRLEEIRILGYIPTTESNVRFKDNTALIGNWISSNRKKIINLYNTNETAKCICQKKGWLISIEKRLEEIGKLDRIPTAKDNIRFKDNTALIGSWIQNNKKEIIKRYDTNEIAKRICDIKVWKISIEDRLEEIGRLGYIPTAYDTIKFKDNSALIGRWIQNNKKEIIKRYETSPIAKEICISKGWKDKKTFEGRLQEIDELGYIPTANDTTKFKDNTSLIGQWIFKNKKELLQRYDTNEIAKRICDAKKWKTTFEDRLQEIGELGYVPIRGNNIRFKDNSAIIYNWISLSKKEIIKRYDTNEIAKRICVQKKWMIDKIAEYIELLNNGYIPKKGESNIRFSNNDPVNQYWHSHKDKIIERLNNDPKYNNGYELAKRIIYIKSLPLEKQKELLLELRNELVNNNKSTNIKK